MNVIVVSGGHVDAALLRRMQDRAGGSTIVLIGEDDASAGCPLRDHDILLSDPMADFEIGRARAQAEIEIRALVSHDLGAPPSEPVWKRQGRHPVSPTGGRGRR